MCKQFIYQFVTSFKGSAKIHAKSNYLILKTFRDIYHAIQTDYPGYNYILNQDKAAYVFAKNFNLEFVYAKNLLTNAIHDSFVKLKHWFYPSQHAKEFILKILNKSHYKLILATNPVWPRSVVEARVAWAGLSPNYFLDITSCENMHSTKPHRSYYLEVLSKYNLKAKDTLMIGNDFRKDAPSIEANIDCYILNNKNSAGNFQKLTSLLALSIK